MTLKVLLIAAATLLPTYREDSAPELADAKAHQAELVASAVLEASKGDRDVAAFLYAWGDAETHFSLRIHEGRCLIWECDKGRARGPWQNHRVAAMSDEQWSKLHGVEFTREQAAEAAKRVRWALKQCPGDRIRGAFRVLGANGCLKPLKGEAERVATFKKVRARL